MRAAPTLAAAPVVSSATVAHAAPERAPAPAEKRDPLALGNQALQRMLISREMQAKLAISEPTDALEREADDVADQVLRMRGPTPPRTNGGDAQLQRKCATCGGASGGAKAKCAACEAEERGLQRKADAATRSAGTPTLASGAGAPLPCDVRSFFEPRFGRDFGAVRVHADAQAAASARSLNALAYTSGRDIVFGDGQYAPGTESGRRLLAHELAHVVQQAGASAATGTAAPRNPTAAASSVGVRVQRLVRRSLVVGCGPGQNPFAADRRASELLTNAVDRIDTARAERPADAADPDVVAIGNAMHTAFRLNPASDDNWNLPAPRFGLPLIRRRLEAARDYIDSVVFTYNCCTVGGACPATCGTCTATETAFVCGGDTSIITLCPLFWTRPGGVRERGRVLAHEVLHIIFGFINDWAEPDRTNAHCYAQFTALANDFNSPADRRCH